MMRNDLLIINLKEHPEPIIRWNTMRYLSGCDPTSLEYDQAKKEAAASPIIEQLLKDRNVDGTLPFHPYNKWFGAHWTLCLLADLGYPEGNQMLRPLLDQCYAWLLSKEHELYIRSINGRVRRCASQEGNCIYYSMVLGLADGRTEELIARLIKWQWEDGGWNCDKRPEAAKSSFNETLIPLRGLSWYANLSGDPKAKHAVNRAAEVFLKRHIFLRLSDGQVIDQNFIRLHYLCYWHYDILFALKVLSESGFIDDPRCTEALDLLEHKQLPDGGFPAEARYYHVDEKKPSGHSRVDWGGTSKVHMNPFVSIDSLRVLKQAGRLIL